MVAVITPYQFIYKGWHPRRITIRVAVYNLDVSTFDVAAFSHALRKTIEHVLDDHIIGGSGYQDRDPCHPVSRAKAAVNKYNKVTKWRLLLDRFVAALLDRLD